MMGAPSSAAFLLLALLAAPPWVCAAFPTTAHPRRGAASMPRPPPPRRSTRKRRLPLHLSEESHDDMNDVQEDVNVQTASSGVTLVQRARVLSYRGAVFASSLLLTGEAVCGSDFLAGSGVDGSSLAMSARAYLPLAAGLSFVLAPGGFAALEDENVENSQQPILPPILPAMLGWGTTLPAFVSVLPHTERLLASFLPDSILYQLALLCLLGVCAREIDYFGRAYKVEAVAAGAALVALEVGQGRMMGEVPSADGLKAISLPVAALAMGVLAFGKVFEPCGEDYVRNNSEFFVDK